MARPEHAPDCVPDYGLIPSIVSWHELANRLAVVETLVQLVEASAPEAMQCGHLDRLKRQVYALRSTAEELSELASGALVDQWESLDTVSLLAQVFDSLRVEAQVGGVVLDRSDDWYLFSPYPPVVRGNRRLLRPALISVVRNAIQFSPAGGRIKVKLLSTRRWVHVQILDEGPGLPPTFAPFNLQLGQTTRPGGHGIGLYITALVVERWHGGHLGLFNRKARGSIAYVRLPRQLEPD